MAGERRASRSDGAPRRLRSDAGLARLRRLIAFLLLHRLIAFLLGVESRVAVRGTSIIPEPLPKIVLRGLYTTPQGVIRALPVRVGWHRSRPQAVLDFPVRLLNFALSESERVGDALELFVFLLLR